MTRAAACGRAAVGRAILRFVAETGCPGRSGKADAADPVWPAELLAYAAGVIDSDGSIGIQRETYAMRVLKTATQPSFTERITIRQIEPGAVDYLHASFGGSRGIIRYRSSSRKRQPLHSLVLGDRKASRVLVALLPYLRIKRRQAELCLELRRLKEESRRARFAYGRGHQGGGKRPEAITRAMELVYAEIIGVNRVEDRFLRHQPAESGQGVRAADGKPPREVAAL